MTAWPDRLVLLGHPLGHTLSPLFQNAALRAANIPLTYEALDVPRSSFQSTLDALRRCRAAGNVTIPYKEVALDACDRVSDTARRVGAVNTFWTAIDGALVGDNTDVAGFEAAIRELFGTPREREVVALFGAGGGAAAVLHAIEGWPDAHVRLYSRSRDRAERLVRRFQTPSEVLDTAESAAAGATVVVNATPLGLRDDSLPVSLDSLPKGSVVFDLAYRPGQTALVRGARTRGHRAADGLSMLVEQGAKSFERWFGRAPDRRAMWDAIAAKR